MSLPPMPPREPVSSGSSSPVPHHGGGFRRGRQVVTLVEGKELQTSGTLQSTGSPHVGGAGAGVTPHEVVVQIRNAFSELIKHTPHAETLQDIEKMGDKECRHLCVELYRVVQMAFTTTKEDEAWSELDTYEHVVSAQASRKLMMNQTLSTVSRAESIASLRGITFQKTTLLQRTVDDAGTKHINQYVICEEIGRGSQGKVKLGYDTKKNEFRAIKVIKRPNSVVVGSARNKLVAERRLREIQREIAVMKRLRHKNLVTLYEVIDDSQSDKLFIVMQYVEKGPLGRGFSFQKFDPIVFTMFARQMCAGLMYLHTHNIVHRDIKPENILRGTDDSVYIADFGLSETLQDDEGEALAVRGTPAFQAPELLIEKEKAALSASCSPQGSPRSVESGTRRNHIGLDEFAIDVWALGVTFFMFLTGRLPWVTNPDNPSDFAVHDYLKAVVNQEPMFPPALPWEKASDRLPEQWVTVLKGMLEKNPEKRTKLADVRQTIKTLHFTPAADPLNSPEKIPASKRESITEEEVEQAFTQCEAFSFGEKAEYPEFPFVQDSLEVSARDEESPGTLTPPAVRVRRPTQEYTEEQFEPLSNKEKGEEK